VLGEDDGTEAALLGARSLFGQKEVFNLSVAEARSYFVGEEGGNGAGVLVYNGRVGPKFKSERVIARRPRTREDRRARQAMRRRSTLLAEDGWYPRQRG
jgi:hypothetical protein